MIKLYRNKYVGDDPLVSKLEKQAAVVLQSVRPQINRGAAKPRINQLSTARCVPQSIYMGCRVNGHT